MLCIFLNYKLNIKNKHKTKYNYLSTSSPKCSAFNS